MNVLSGYEEASLAEAELEHKNWEVRRQVLMVFVGNYEFCDFFEWVTWWATRNLSGEDETSSNLYLKIHWPLFISTHLHSDTILVASPNFWISSVSLCWLVLSAWLDEEMPCGLLNTSLGLTTETFPEMPKSWTYSNEWFNPLIDSHLNIVLVRFFVLFCFCVKHRSKINFWKKEFLIWLNGMRAHYGRQAGMPASGRRGCRSRKLSNHVFNCEHEAHGVNWWWR